MTPLATSLPRESRRITRVYGAFSRLLQDIDEGGTVLQYEYDIYGRQTREFTTGTTRNVERSYDAAGNLTRINDTGTGTTTDYTYDKLGRRVTEVLTTPGNAHDRNITYEYGRR